MARSGQECCVESESLGAPGSEDPAHVGAIGLALEPFALVDTSIGDSKKSNPDRATSVPSSSAHSVLTSAANH